MNCRETQQMIYRYLNNDLDERELQAFLDHVRECPSCYEELEIYYSVQEAIEYLEDDGRGAMNPAQLLKFELEDKRRGLRRYKLFRSFQMLLILAAFAGIVMTGVVQVKLVGESIYEMIAGGEEAPDKDADQDKVPDEETEVSQ